MVWDGAAARPAMHEERWGTLRVAVDGVGDFMDADGYGAGLVGVERRVQRRAAIVFQTRLLRRHRATRVVAAAPAVVLHGLRVKQRALRLAAMLPAARVGDA